MDLSAMSDIDKQALMERKARIETALGFGMSLTRAIIAAGCTDEEAKYFETNAEIQGRIQFYSAKAELETLELHSVARTIGARKGASGPLEWYLGKINPERWGNGKNELSLPNQGRLLEFDPAQMSDEELRRALT